MAGRQAGPFFLPSLLPPALLGSGSKLDAHGFLVCDGVAVRVYVHEEHVQVVCPVINTTQELPWLGVGVNANDFCQLLTRHD